MKDDKKSFKEKKEEASKLEKSYEILTIIRRMRELSHKRMKRFFEDFNLTAPQGMTVSILSYEGEMRVSDLSKKMSISNSTVSGIIDRLEKQGYVQRRRDSKDRRVVMIHVTEEIDREIKKRMKLMEDSTEKLVEYGTEEEIDKVLEGFKILVNLVEKSEENVEKERE